MQSAAEILATIDAAAESFALPMLDNGYLYLAATRLSLFRSATDWAMVVEIFGFSPRAGLPDLAVTTVASSLHARNPPSQYVSEDAHRNYLAQHPHDDVRSFHPLEDGSWIDGELVAETGDAELTLRGRKVPAPPRGEYARCGIELEDSQRVHVFELCRYFAAVAREQVLAPPDEQRVSVLPDMQRLLQLDEWAHPDLAGEQRPSQLESFRQLAEVLATGEAGRYKPTSSPNTHWVNWPEGGTL